ncbi:MAG: hypothetical protein ACRYE8_03250 [Janthinobacterium lividum]
MYRSKNAIYVITALALLRGTVFLSLRENYEVIDEAIQLKNANL